MNVLTKMGNVCCSICQETVRIWKRLYKQVPIVSVVDDIKLKSRQKCPVVLFNEHIALQMIRSGRKLFNF